MTLFEELAVFIKSILHWIYSLAFFSFFFFAFGLKEVFLFGQKYFLPLPAQNSFSIQIFNRIKHDLLPPEVQLLVTNPMSAFVSQILLSMLLGFLSTMPFFIYKIILYVQPALLPHEKKAVLLSLLPFAFLFFSGAAFAYFFLIPATFEVLYPYATTIGAVPFFSIDEFIYYVFSLMIMVGLVFLLPLFMVILSILHVVEASFWIRKWKYACLFFLILSAIITPDGTGITMALLFLPLMALYFAGYFFAGRLSKNHN